jgi:hypothetical protein
MKWMIERMANLLMRPDEFWAELKQDLLQADPMTHPILAHTPLFHFTSDPTAILSPPPKRTKGRVGVRREIWSGNCIDFYEPKPLPVVKKEEIE